MIASTIDSSILSYLKNGHLLEEGHFAFASGLHGPVSLDYDRLLADPTASSRMGYALAKTYFTAKIDTVAAPSIWGAGLAQWVAWFLEPRASVVYGTPTPDGGRRIAPNLVPLIEGKRVLLIDNVALTGKTMQAFGEQVHALGGDVLGLGCIWSGVHSNGDSLVFGLLNGRYPAWPASDCPLCAEGNTDLQVRAL